MLMNLITSLLDGSRGSIYILLGYIISLLCVSAGALQLFSYRSISKSHSSSLVVITGCDSGFGEMASRSLSARGFQVLSLCLSQEGVDRISGSVSEAMICDVTKQADIDKVVRKVEALTSVSPSVSSTGLQLWALVNNAGIAPIGYVDWMKMDSFRSVMDVNFFGLVAMTKAMLPILKRQRGSRIINISSMAAFLASPGFGGYAASKHALEGFSKSLREELEPWGIHVSK